MMQTKVSLFSRFKTETYRHIATWVQFKYKTNNRINDNKTISYWEEVVGPLLFLFL